MNQKVILFDAEKSNRNLRLSMKMIRIALMRALAKTNADGRVGKVPHKYRRYQ